MTAALERSVGPDLLLVARTLTSARAVPLLAGREPRTDARGRAHIAVALATHPPELARPLIAKLVERREGYTTAHAMDTLAGWGDPADASVIARVVARESHEVVRLHALRAAGVIGGDRARCAAPRSTSRRRASRRRRSRRCSASTRKPTSSRRWRATRSRAPRRGCARPHAPGGTGFRVWTLVGPCRSLRPGWPDGVPALGQPLAPGDGVEMGRAESWWCATARATR